MCFLRACKQTLTAVADVSRAHLSYANVTKYEAVFEYNNCWITFDKNPDNYQAIFISRC